MKKLIQKIVLLVVIGILMNPNFAQADSYIWEGTGIGAGVGAAAGIALILASDTNNNCIDDCNLKYAAAGASTALGALLGLGIGALIPKNPKITFSPVLTPTKDGVNAGGNFSIKF